MSKIRFKKRKERKKKSQQSIGYESQFQKKRKNSVGKIFYNIRNTMNEVQFLPKFHFEAIKPCEANNNR